MNWQRERERERKRDQYVERKRKALKQTISTAPHPYKTVR
jgi:hypothetical protein